MAERDPRMEPKAGDETVSFYETGCPWPRKVIGRDKKSVKWVTPEGEIKSDIVFWRKINKEAEVVHAAD